MNKLDKYLNEKFVKLNRIKRLEFIHPKTENCIDKPLAIVYDNNNYYWTNVYLWHKSKGLNLTTDQIEYIRKGGKMVITSSGMIKELFKRKQPLKPEEKKRLKIIG